MPAMDPNAAMLAVGQTAAAVIRSYRTLAIVPVTPVERAHAAAVANLETAMREFSVFTPMMTVFQQMLEAAFQVDQYAPGVFAHQQVEAAPMAMPAPRLRTRAKVRLALPDGRAAAARAEAPADAQADERRVAEQDGESVPRPVLTDAECAVLVDLPLRPVVSTDAARRDRVTAAVQLLMADREAADYPDAARATLHDALLLVATGANEQARQEARALMPRFAAAA